MNDINIKLIVGLGNPGSKYANTRHNVGFNFIEYIVHKERKMLKYNKNFLGKFSDIKISEKYIKLLMPDTFMNESGRSISSISKWMNLSAENILIIVDDIDMPFGKIRLRRKGSSGGHNGLKSIENHLGSIEFARIKIGIGSPIHDEMNRNTRVIKHVLSKFTYKESMVLEELYSKIFHGICMIEHHSLERATTFLNSLKVI